MILTPTSLPAAGEKPREQALMQAAQNLEASFLAEMLESAGLGKTSESFGGGAGEDQFEEQSKHIVQTGGIGLAQSLFDILKERSNDA